MSCEITSIKKVSDGIMVSFDAGLSCYYPATFLLEQAGVGSNVIFLDNDPSDLITTDIAPIDVSSIAVMANLIQH